MTTMSREDIDARLATISAHLFDAVGGDQQTPLCDLLDAELQVEDHKDIHDLFTSLALAAQQFGFQRPHQFVAYAFTFGRKWGLMEAAAAMNVDGMSS